jgi:NADH-quinone oxidoreductase subunit J
VSGGAVLLATGGATVPDLITFVVAAAFVLAGAVGVVTSRNPVHAALALVLTLFGVAVLFIEQQADFLAAVQVIVYAGAIVVLFLFVIMFLGVDRLEDLDTEPLRGQRPLAMLLVLMALGGLLALFVESHWVTGAHEVAGSTTGGGHTNVYLLGKSIFTTYLFAFEATAALLVIAVVGAVVLARRPPGGSGEWLDGPDTPKEAEPQETEGTGEPEPEHSEAGEPASGVGNGAVEPDQPPAEPEPAVVAARPLPGAAEGETS